jgi:hypothetical protein
VQLSLECSGAPQYEFCLDSLLTKLQARNQKVVVLWVTEALHIQRVVKEKYGARLILPSGEPVAPIDFIDKQLYDAPVKSKEECDRIKRLDKHSALTIARDMYLLSLTDIQIISTSGALGLVAASSKLTPTRRSTYGLSILHTEKKMCNATDGDDLAFFVDNWRQGI